MTDEAAHPIVRSSTPVRKFDDLGEVTAVAVFPDRRRMATSSSDGMLRIRDLKNGVLLKELEGHGDAMGDIALSRDGQLIASSDRGGYVMAWHGDTGKALTRPFQAHVGNCSLDFSPDGVMLATGSLDYTVKLWSAETWQVQGSPMSCDHRVHCVRYSPSGKLLAVATNYYLEVWGSDLRARITQVAQGPTVSLVWTPDGTRLLSGDRGGSSIWEWDSSSWGRIGDIWKGDTGDTWRFAMNCNGTVIASPATDNRVRLWRLLDRRTIAIFHHSGFPCCVTFSMDGRRILAGGKDKSISEWAVPEHAWPANALMDLSTHVEDCDTEVEVPDTNAEDTNTDAEDVKTKIIAMKTAVRNACISGDLPTAEELLTQEIDANGDNYRSYASRSIVRARKLDWEKALHDANKSLSIRPSLMGYISKAIALCGQKQVRDASRAFDLAFTFTDPNTIHLLFLIKAMAFFSANRHADAIRRVRELAATYPNTDITLTCRIVEVYLHIQLGNKSLERDRPSEATDHFTAAVKTGTFLSKSLVDAKYEDFAVLFGCDFTSLWQTANQKRCHALLRAGKLAEVFEAVRYMADMSDEATKASSLDWSIGLMQELSTFRGNAPSIDATSTPDRCKYDDDESVSLSDIDSDIDHVDDVVG